MAYLRLPQGIIAFDIGLGLVVERQDLRRADRGRREGFAIDEAMKQVEDVGLCGHARLQRHVVRQHRLLVVLKDQRQDVDHLAITAGLLEQVLLQGSEGVGKFAKWRAVAQSAGLALHYG